MDRSHAMTKIMTILNEDGLLVPGGQTHKIVMEYMNFKIDRLGPDKAIQDVLNTKDHLVAQIGRMNI